VEHGVGIAAAGYVPLEDQALPVSALWQTKKEFAMSRLEELKAARKDLDRLKAALAAGAKITDFAV